MAENSNLTIQIGADATKLRADLAVAQAQVRAFGTELRRAAQESLTGANDNGLQKLASQALAAETRVKSLRAEVNALGGAKGAESLTESFRVLPGVVLRARESMGGLKEAAEAVGALFVLERVRSWAEGIAEAGERALNLSAALGINIGQFVQLQGVMQLAGGSAEEASRAMERLARSVGEALRNPTSQQREAFRVLGVGMDEVRAKSGNMMSMLELLVRVYGETNNSMAKTAAFEELVGRGYERLIPLFRQGTAGVAENKAVLDRFNASAEAAAKAGADTAEKLNVLKTAARGASDDGFLILKPVIDFTTTSMTNMLGVAQALIAVLNAAEAASRDVARGMAQIGTFDPNSGLMITGSAPSAAPGSALRGMDTLRAAAAARRGSPWAGAGHTSMGFGGVEPASGSIIFPGGEGGDFTKRDVPWMGKLKAGNPASDISAEFRLEIAEERAKGDAAQATATRIEGIYQEWLARLAGIYGQDSKEYRNVAVEKLNFERENQARIYELAASSSQKRIAIMREELKGFEALQKTRVDRGEITSQQGFALDITKVQEIAQASRELLTNLAPLATTADLRTKLADAADQITAWSKTTTAELQQQWTAAGQKAAEAWAAPFKSAFSEIAGSVENAFAGLLTRSTTLRQAEIAIGQSLTKGLVTMGGGILSKGITAALPGSKEGEGLGEYFGRQLTELILHSSLLTAIVGNTAATAAASTAGAGTSAAGSIAGGGISAAGSIAGGGGGGLFGWIGSLFGAGAAGAGGYTTGSALSGLEALGGAAAPLGFRHGGIVPSAAGGWQLPSFPGAQLTMLHSREMVLPAHIANWVQNAAAQGGGGGGTHLHAHFHGPADGPSVERWMRSEVERRLPDMIRRATARNSLNPFGRT